MVNLVKRNPQVPLVLAFLILWFSSAWGLPAEAPAGDGEGEATPASVTEPAGPLTGSRVPEEPKKVTAWLYVGLGLGAPAIAGNSGLNVKYGRYQATLCAAIQTWNDSHTDIGVLLGYCPLPTLAFAAGVARARIGTFHPYPYNPIFPGAGDIEYSYTVGVPVEIQFTPIKGRFVGLGVVGHGNFNKEEIFGGATVGIELGKLK